MEKRKKNILYISPVGYWGGVERFLEKVYTSHKYHSDFNSQVVFLNKGPFYDHCLSEFENVHSIDFTLRLRNLFSILKFRSYIQNFINKNNIEIIHCPMPYSFIICKFSLWGMKDNKPKIILFQHGPIGGLLDQVASFLKKDFQIFNSKHTQSKVEILYGSNITKAKSEIIYPIIEDQNVEKVSSDNEEIKFVSISRITPWKGIENNIDIFKKYHDSNESCSYDIWGGCNSKNDEIYLNKIQQKIEKLGLEEKIKIKGFAQDLKEIYKKADVFLHWPVIAEPFGMSIVEAMSSKTLVVTKKQGGCADFINEKNAITHEKNDFNYIVETLKVSLDDRSVYKTKVSNARNWYIANMNKDSLIKKLFDIYSKL